MCNSDGRLVIVGQLYNYAEFSGGFLLRVGNQCGVDIKADFILIGTIYPKFGVVTSCKWCYEQLYWA